MTPEHTALLTRLNSLLAYFTDLSTTPRLAPQGVHYQRAYKHVVDELKKAIEGDALYQSIDPTGWPIVIDSMAAMLGKASPEQERAALLDIAEKVGANEPNKTYTRFHVAKGREVIGTYRIDPIKRGEAMLFASYANKPRASDVLGMFSAKVDKVFITPEMSYDEFTRRMTQMARLLNTTKPNGHVPIKTYMKPDPDHVAALALHGRLNDEQTRDVLTRAGVVIPKQPESNPCAHEWQEGRRGPWFCSLCGQQKPDSGG